MYSAQLFLTARTELLQVGPTQLKAHLRHFLLSAFSEIAYGMKRNFKVLSRQQILQLRCTKTITCKSQDQQYCHISFFGIACSNGNRPFKINIYCFVTIQML